MAYQRKTRDVWHLEVNYGYGHGWEREITEYTRDDGRKRLRDRTH